MLCPPSGIKPMSPALETWESQPLDCQGSPQKLLLKWARGMAVCALICIPFVTPWTVAYQASLSTGFSRQEYWSGLHFLLQGTLLNQGSNLQLLHLLHWQEDSLPLNHSGSPHTTLDLKQKAERWWQELAFWFSQSIQNPSGEVIGYQPIRPISFLKSILRSSRGNSLAVQWLGCLGFTAEDPSSIPCWETKFPWAMRCSREKKKK